jgi:DNA (cytosine-5)-methyltransferase 1
MLGFCGFSPQDMGGDMSTRKARNRTARRGLKTEQNAWDTSVPIEQNAYNWQASPKYEPPSTRVKAGGPSVVDLFSGCGGISAGLAQAGLQTALALDIHAPSIDTFRRNHPESGTILGDIKRLKNDALLDALGDTRVDMVVGGAPCQGFSLCNRKQFDDDSRNMLFKEYMRVVRLLRPEFVLFENVQNIRSVADGKYARLIEQHFESLGYSVISGPVNALEFGVPQKRMRWIFFGIRGEGLRVPWPIGDHRGHVPFTVYDAIGDLPELGNDDAVTVYGRDADREFQRAMRHGATKLLNHESPRHPQETVERIQRTKPGKPMYESFRQRIRLSWDEPSPTQVSGGIRPQFQFGHPGQPRGLSVRERCRIQSFPDTYEILGGIVQGRVQTGNAVPPRIAEAFGRAVMSLITGEDRIALRHSAEQIVLPLVSYA